MAQAGRPSEYADYIAEEILTRLSDGETLIAICRTDGMPDRSTVNRWMVRDDEFAARIARARDIGQDSTVDECREIVDSATPEDFQVARLRVWHRQWEASKRAPKRFGERLVQEHHGPNGGPIQFVAKSILEE
jgi:hypothetical protein